MTTECLSVYVTVSSQEEAESIARVVLGEGLAACVNIFPKISSFYRWKGEIAHNEECALLLKTTVHIVDALQARLKELHSYEIPCIVAWPIIQGNPAYLEWLKGEIGK